MAAEAEPPPLDEAPGPLTVKGVPVEPNLRILAVATLVKTLGTAP